MGFHEKWIQLIIKCIITVSYSVIINGAVHGSIFPTRGLCQGDPLSPYLFLLCADGFSSLINEAVRNQGLSGISIWRGCPMVSHLFFADDSLLFCKASDKNAAKWLRSLSFTKLLPVKKLMRRNPLLFLAIIPFRKVGVWCWTSLVRCKTLGMGNTWGFHPLLEGPRPKFLQK